MIPNRNNFQANDHIKRRNTTHYQSHGLLNLYKEQKKNQEISSQQRRYQLETRRSRNLSSKDHITEIAQMIEKNRDSEKTLPSIQEQNDVQFQRLPFQKRYSEFFGIKDTFSNNNFNDIYETLKQNNNSFQKDQIVDIKLDENFNENFSEDSEDYSDSEDLSDDSSSESSNNDQEILQKQNHMINLKRFSQASRNIEIDLENYQKYTQEEEKNLNGFFQEQNNVQKENNEILSRDFNFQQNLIKDDDMEELFDEDEEQFFQEQEDLLNFDENNFLAQNFFEKKNQPELITQQEHQLHNQKNIQKIDNNIEIIEYQDEEPEIDIFTPKKVDENQEEENTHFLQKKILDENLNSINQDTQQDQQQQQNNKPVFQKIKIKVLKKQNISEENNIKNNQIEKNIKSNSKNQEELQLKMKGQFESKKSLQDKEKDNQQKDEVIKPFAKKRQSIQINLSNQQPVIQTKPYKRQSVILNANPTLQKKNSQKTNPSNSKNSQKRKSQLQVKFMSKNNQQINDQNNGKQSEIPDENQNQENTNTKTPKVEKRGSLIYIKNKNKSDTLKINKVIEEDTEEKIYDYLEQAKKISIQSMTQNNFDINEILNEKSSLENKQKNNSQLSSKIEKNLNQDILTEQIVNQRLSNLTCEILLEKQEEFQQENIEKQIFKEFQRQSIVLQEKENQEFIDMKNLANSQIRKMTNSLLENYKEIQNQKKNQDQNQEYEMLAKKSLNNIQGKIMSEFKEELDQKEIRNSILNDLKNQNFIEEIKEQNIQDVKYQNQVEEIVELNMNDLVRNSLIEIQEQNFEQKKKNKLNSKSIDKNLENIVKNSISQMKSEALNQMRDELLQKEIRQSIQDNLQFQNFIETDKKQDEIQLYEKLARNTLKNLESELLIDFHDDLNQKEIRNSILQDLNTKEIEIQNKENKNFDLLARQSLQMLKGEILVEIQEDLQLKEIRNSVIDDFIFQEMLNQDQEKDQEDLYNNLAKKSLTLMKTQILNKVKKKLDYFEIQKSIINELSSREIQLREIDTMDQLARKSLIDIKSQALIDYQENLKFNEIRNSVLQDMKGQEICIIENPYIINNQNLEKIARASMNEMKQDIFCDLKKKLDLQEMRKSIVQNLQIQEIEKNQEEQYTQLVKQSIKNMQGEILSSIREEFAQQEVRKSIHNELCNQDRKTDIEMSKKTTATTLFKPKKKIFQEDQNYEQTIQKQRKTTLQPQTFTDSKKRMTINLKQNIIEEQNNNDEFDLPQLKKISINNTNGLIEDILGGQINSSELEKDNQEIDLTNEDLIQIKKISQVNTNNLINLAEKEFLLDIKEQNQSDDEIVQLKKHSQINTQNIIEKCFDQIEINPINDKIQSEDEIQILKKSSNVNTNKVIQKCFENFNFNEQNLSDKQEPFNVQDDEEIQQLKKQSQANIEQLLNNCVIKSEVQVQKSYELQSQDEINQIRNLSESNLQSIMNSCIQNEKQILSLKIKQEFKENEKKQDIEINDEILQIKKLSQHNIDNLLMSCLENQKQLSENNLFPTETVHINPQSQNNVEKNSNQQDDEIIEIKRLSQQNTNSLLFSCLENPKNIEQIHQNIDHENEIIQIKKLSALNIENLLTSCINNEKHQLCTNSILNTQKQQQKNLQQQIEHIYDDEIRELKSLSQTNFNRISQSLLNNLNKNSIQDNINNIIEHIDEENPKQHFQPNISQPKLKMMHSISERTLPKIQLDRRLSYNKSNQNKIYNKNQMLKKIMEVNEDIDENEVKKSKLKKYPTLLEMKINLMQSRRFKVQPTKKIRESAKFDHNLQKFLESSQFYQDYKKNSEQQQRQSKIEKIQVTEENSDAYSFNPDLWEETFTNDLKEQQKIKNQEKIDQKAREMQKRYEQGLIQQISNLKNQKFNNHRVSKLQQEDQEDPECYQKQWEKYQMEYSMKFMKKINEIQNKNISAQEKEKQIKNLINNKISNRFLIQTLKLKQQDLEKIKKLQKFMRKKLDKIIKNRIEIAQKQFKRASKLIELKSVLRQSQCIRQQILILYYSKILKKNYLFFFQICFYCIIQNYDQYWTYCSQLIYQTTFIITINSFLFINFFNTVFQTMVIFIHTNSPTLHHQSSSNSVKRIKNKLEKTQITLCNNPFKMNQFIKTFIGIFQIFKWPKI